MDITEAAFERARVLKCQLRLLTPCPVYEKRSALWYILRLTNTTRRTRRDQDILGHPHLAVLLVDGSFKGFRHS